MKHIFYILASLITAVTLCVISFSCINQSYAPKTVAEYVAFDSIDVDSDCIKDCSEETKWEIFADVTEIKLIDETVTLLSNKFDNLTEKEIRTYYNTHKVEGFNPFVEYTKNSSTLAGLHNKYEKNVYHIPEGVVKSILAKIDILYDNNFYMYAKYHNNL